ncbi:MAG: RecX family transcriptional regulator [Bacteroidota bacterium]
MFITKILRKKKRPPVYAVSVDGTLAFELSEEVFVRFGLHTGGEITEKTVEQIVTTEALTRATRTAVNYLSYRPRSSKETAQHLIRKGHSSELARRVVQQLTRQGMINDLEFARMFVRDKVKRKPVGKALLRQSLLEKGISPPVAEQVLKEYISDEEQQVAAEKLAARRLNLAHATFQKLDPVRRKKRLLEYLLRRGFSSEVAHKTVRAVLT